MSKYFTVTTTGQRAASLLASIYGQANESFFFAVDGDVLRLIPQVNGHETHHTLRLNADGTWQVDSQLEVVIEAPN